MSFDVGDSVTYGSDLLRFLFGDGDTEFLLEVHHEFYSFERISTEVVGEAGFVLHFVGVYRKLLNDELLYLLRNFRHNN